MKVIKTTDTDDSLCIIAYELDTYPKTKLVEHSAKEVYDAVSMLRGGF